jgi:gas vesicle protein
MEKTEMNCHRGSALLGFLTGLGAGIGLTVLLAPRSGAATRRLIGCKVEEGEGWVKNKAAAAQKFVKGQVEELSGRADEAAHAIGRG